MSKPKKSKKQYENNKGNLKKPEKNQETRGREEGKTEYRKIRSKNISGKDKEKLKEYLKMYRSMKKQCCKSMVILGLINIKFVIIKTQFGQMM